MTTEYTEHTEEIRVKKLKSKKIELRMARK